MAEPTSKFQPETLDFIARNARKADRIAKALGLAPNAMMGAVANEYDTRHNPELGSGFSGAAGQWFGDGLSQWNPWYQKIDHGNLEESYYEEKTEERSPDWIDRHAPKKIASLIDKIKEPASVDVGPGNIKLGTAVDLLEAYVAQHPDEGDDPLGLKKYVGRYDRLRDDLLNFEDADTTLAFAGLMVGRAEPFFIARDEASWSRLSPDERDALRIMYYKLGPETLSNNIAESKVNARTNGQRYDFNPNGDGGEQHLNNLGGIENAFQLGRVQGENVMPYVPEDELEKEPYFDYELGLPTRVYRKGTTILNPQYTYDPYSTALNAQGKLPPYAGFDSPVERLRAEGAKPETAGDASVPRLSGGTAVRPPPQDPAGKWKGKQRFEPGRRGATDFPDALRFWDDAVRGRASLKEMFEGWTE
ncbi:hypothetical protein [Sinorhizobium meliloti]|jgi:hypothetical protein|uniref:hypothetical protein n=1 Tax=Rhizobium meliloti TaxID=382 RepID=UPI003F137F4B